MIALATSTMKPTRIQLSRTKGFSLQSVSHALNGLGCVKVDRSTPWGNPFHVGRHGTQAKCVDRYRLLMAGLLCVSADNVDAQQACREYVDKHSLELAGKNLACWCPILSHGVYVPCHADVLLEIVNKAR